MSTITHAAGVIVPVVAGGWEATRPARSVVHEVLGRSDPDVTLRPAGTRRGTLRLVFAAEADAADASVVLGRGEVFTFADPDRGTLGMSFVVADGDVSLSLDDETRDVWIVLVPFVEVVQ